MTKEIHEVVVQKLEKETHKQRNVRPGDSKMGILLQTAGPDKDQSYCGP